MGVSERLIVRQITRIRKQFKFGFTGPAKTAILLFPFTFFLSCSPVKIVNTDSANDFKLSNYKTFDFVEVQVNGDTLEKPYSEEIKFLTAAITEELEEKGLKWNHDEPDMLVNIGIVVQDKVQTRPTNFASDAPYYIGQRRYSWKSEDVEVGQYKQGTVTVHLIDRILNKMVWRGIAEGVISKKQNLLEKDIKRGMDELFSRVNSPSKQ